jgi:CheY-like chemotaxis protein
MHNILLIEDNPQHADLAMRILQSNNFTVEHVERASRGIQASQRHLPSLIIVDLELPDMTGQTACMLLRRQMGRTTPPIIAVTGHVGHAYRQSAKQAGCQAFINKPYPPTQLLETVRYFLEKIPLNDISVLL